MLFNSIEFLCAFLPLTLVGFYTIARWSNTKFAIAWLVAASIFFYGWWNPKYLLLLSFSLLFNYGTGTWLSTLETTDRSKQKKVILGIGVIVNLALIAYFKYANFFVDSFNNILPTDFIIPKIILPLAISFFTFQQIAYLVDSYKGETKAYSFLSYSLFVCFFPQLIAGPIVHHKEVMPQFEKAETFKFQPNNMAIALTIFTIGLIKKVLIADKIAVYATPVFYAASQGENLSLYEAWSGALFYGFQLYFDFCGYSEMALGAARMFNIILPLNFNSPYKAASIAEFWRRWHITLSNFLRDYIYIPLGGNRQGEVRRNVNLMITMLLGGLWHGAGWTFVFWGGLHGFYLTLNHSWTQLWRRWKGKDAKVWWWDRIWGVGLTFTGVTIAWVFFRAENMEVAMNICGTMFGANGWSLGSTVVPSEKKLLILLLLFVWLLPNTQEWMARYTPSLTFREAGLPVKLQWRPHPVIAAGLGVAVFVIFKLLLEAPDSEFLYFNF